MKKLTELITEIPANDDLFARPPRSVWRRPQLQTARITCRVCERPAEVPILATGLLCDACRSDLAATACHIADRLARAETARDAAGERYEAAWLDADETTHDQLDRILAQRETLDFMQRMTRARALPDWNAAVALWELRSVIDTAATMLDQVRAWAKQARHEVTEATQEE